MEGNLSFRTTDSFRTNDQVKSRKLQLSYCEEKKIADEYFGGKTQVIRNSDFMTPIFVTAKNFKSDIEQIQFKFTYLFVQPTV